MNLEELQTRIAFLERENLVLRKAIRELVSEPNFEQTVSTKQETATNDFSELLKKVNKKIKDGFVYSEQELDFIKNANKSGFEPTKNQYNWLLRISNKKPKIEKAIYAEEEAYPNRIDPLDIQKTISGYNYDDIPF